MQPTPPAIAELDRAAVVASLEMVGRVGAEDLGRPTPCVEWTLADLLAHMTAQHHGFASAANGGTDLDAWRVRPLGDDPVPAYTAAAREVMAAFAEDGVARRAFTLPEISTSMTFPGEQAMGFHFIDYVVHTWDVARCLGVRLDLPEDLLAAAEPIARAVPDGKQRLRPGAAFRPGVAVAGGAGTLDRIVAMLGRSPAWPS